VVLRAHDRVPLEEVARSNEEVVEVEAADLLFRRLIGDDHGPELVAEERREIRSGIGGEGLKPAVERVAPLSQLGGELLGEARAAPSPVLALPSRGEVTGPR